MVKKISHEKIYEFRAKKGSRVGKTKRFLYNHFLFYILKEIPRLQYSEYGTPQTGEKWIARWFSWFGHVFWCKHYLLDPKDRNF